jgi:hypothetical protein
MYQLLYVSEATHSMSKNELLSLLQQSKLNNYKQHITGLMLYKDQRFMQILEGNETDVENLYAKIAQDSRHHELVVLLRKQTDKPLFKDWSMGFIDLDNDEAARIPGYSDFLNTPLNSKNFISDPSLTMQFLYIFKFAHIT